MTEIRKNVDKPNDKPNDPPYPGGEDETPGDHASTRNRDQRSSDFPVDENDEGPPTAPGDIREGH